MKKQCNHWIGIWDSEYSVIGRCMPVYQSDSWLAKNYPEDMVWFDFCPDCGERLVKEKV